jgi:hypothetical protein
MFNNHMKRKWGFSPSAETRKRWKKFSLSQHGGVFP